MDSNRLKTFSKVKLSSSTRYRILLTAECNDPTCDGQTWPETKEIEINYILSDGEFSAALFHELLHAINYDKELKLTEGQIRGLENGLINLIGSNKGFFDCLVEHLKSINLSALNRAYKRWANGEG